jgi:hypothetical protein
MILVDLSSKFITYVYIASNVGSFVGWSSFAVKRFLVLFSIYSCVCCYNHFHIIVITVMLLKIEVEKLTKNRTIKIYILCKFSRFDKFNFCALKAFIVPKSITIFIFAVEFKRAYNKYNLYLYSRFE